MTRISCKWRVWSVLLTLLLCVVSHVADAPIFTVGMWKNITPADKPKESAASAAGTK